jgi:CheY-like chemotaxis protein
LRPTIVFFRGFVAEKPVDRAGLTVIVATDGAQGIAMAKPDLILMDLRLPDIRGWEATRRIKADPATKIGALTPREVRRERDRRRNRSACRN